MRKSNTINIAIVFLLLLSLVTSQVAYASSPYYYYVNAYDNTYNEWTRVGASPYLDAIDWSANYVAAPVAALKKVGIWNFPNSGAENAETLNNVYVEIYADGGEDPDLGWPSVNVYVWNGAAWTLYNVVVNSVWAWFTLDVSALINTWAKVDSCRVYFRATLVGAKTLIVDCMRLKATSSPAGAWHDVSTWTASLATRTWSSGTSWSFTLPTMQWNSVYALYEYYNANDDSADFICGAQWCAQTFTVGTSGHMVTSVKLLLYRVGSPQTITVGIRATDSGHPTGSDLTNGTINGNSLTENTAGAWYKIALTEYTLSASTKYAIAVRAPSATSGNYLFWRMDISATTYAGGNFEHSVNSGGTWTSDIDYDGMFEVWGTPVNSNLLTRQNISVASWLFGFGTRIWVDVATWTYNWVTMAWQNIIRILYLGTSIWKDIATWATNLSAMLWNDVATWVFYPLTRLWNDATPYAFNLLTRAWNDFTWFFDLLPRLPEWVNVAVWIFSLRSPEWMLLALLNFQLGGAGIAFLFIAILLLIVIVAGIIAIAYRRPKR